MRETVLVEPKQRLVGVAVMLLWCVWLLAYRSHLMLHSSVSPERIGLETLWKIFLLVVPLLWTWTFRSASTRRRPVTAIIFCFVWLLFVPNPPYLLIDFIRLRPSPVVPLWYLLAVLMSCAGAGTILGYLSLIHVQAVIEQKLGKKIGWAVAVCSLLCSFGISLLTGYLALHVFPASSNKALPYLAGR